MMAARGPVLAIMILAIAALGTATFFMRSTGDATTESSSSSAQTSSTAVATFLAEAATTEFEPLRGECAYSTGMWPSNP